MVVNKTLVAIKMVGFLGALALTCPLQAQGSADQLKPSEINTTGESSNPTNDSSFFLGGGFSFGQARSTEGGSAAGLSYLAMIEPGYQINTGSWSRVEFSSALLVGQVSFRNPAGRGGKTTMPLNFGLLVKGGYGYSLGNRAFGLVKLGAGMVSADYEAEVGTAKAEADALSGLAAQFAYEMVFPINETLDFNAGFSWTHMQFDVDSVEVAGVKRDADQPINLNIPQLQLALRARL